MSLEKTFYLLKAAETNAAELYALIGLSIAVLQPTLSNLFMELSAEEKLHCKQIELMQNIFLQGKDAFTRCVRLLRAPRVVILDLVPGAD